MIQLVLRVTKFCLVLLLTLFLGSCKFDVQGPNFLNTISGSGNIIKEKREVLGNFDKIEVSSSIEVELEQAPNFEIIVEAEDNIIPYLLTEISGNTLKIHFDNVSVSLLKDAKVYVKMPEISELRASSSEIEVKNSIKSEDLILKTSSTADIKLSEITAKSVIAEASSSSDIKIEKIYTLNFNAQSSSTAEIEIEYIESDKINLTANSSSDIVIKGKALDLNANTSSTGTIDAKYLLVNNVVASASSSSTIKTHPIVSLNAKASSASDIYYYNEPKEPVEKSISSSGSVERKN